MKDVSPKKDTIAKNLKKKKTTIPVPSKPTKKGNSNSIQLSQRQSSLPRNEVPNNTTI
jgi:hypothetical protein